LARLARTGDCPTWDYLERARPLVVRCRGLNRTFGFRTLAGAVGITVAVAVVAASSYQGCAVYNPSLLNPGGSDASADAPSGTDVVAACHHAAPPSRPAPPDGGVDDYSIPPVVAAFRTIDIGVSGDVDAAIPPFGYDLDNDCTCPGPPSCTPQAGSTNSFCDDEAGRDNTDIQLFRLLRGPASTGTSQIDQGLTAGQYGLLVVITNYNGTPDDSVVRVDFYVSNGLNRAPDGSTPAPKFDGTDRWTIDPHSLLGGAAGGQPIYSDPSAYVAANVVVAHLAQLPIAFGDRSFLGGATMQLYGAVIVGQLVDFSLGDGGNGNGLGLALSGGTIAGRWPTTQILSTLATIPEEGGFLCGTDPVDYDIVKYDIVKDVICRAADISTLSTEDNTTPTLAPCDAISVGMQFTAVPAQLGDVLVVPPAPAGCQDGGIAWSDSCGQ
jgi:hypothetical protein